MTALHIPDRKCNHITLIDAVHEAGLAEAKDTEIKLVFKPGVFYPLSFLSLLCAWGLLRRQAGCTFAVSASARSADVGYPSRMDLFRHLGVDYREAFTRHDPGERFQPLLLVGPDGVGTGEAVTTLLNILHNSFAGSERFQNGLSWIIQELVDNIANHAQSPVSGLVSAQFYPNQKRLDIAVWDAGVGLQRTLEGRYPVIFSAGDAVTKALERGATRDPEIGQGNGLAGSMELVQSNGGELHVWSGNATRHIVPDKDPYFELTKSRRALPGTGLLIRLRTDRPLDIGSLSLTSGKRHIDAAKTETPPEKPEAGEIRVMLAQEDYLSGRAAARVLREKLLTRLQTPETTLFVDFQGIGVPAHSYLDELFGRLLGALGGYEAFDDRVELLNCPDWVLDSLNYVLELRHGERGAESSSGKGKSNAVPPLLVKNMPLICNPATIVVTVDPGTGSTIVSRERLKAVWPEAHIEEVTTAQAGFQALAKAQRPVLVIPFIQSFHNDQRKTLHTGATTMPGWFIERIAKESADEDGIFLLTVPSAWSGGDAEFKDRLFQADKLRLVMDMSPEIWGREMGVTLRLFGFGPLREREAPHQVGVINGERIFGKPLKTKESKQLMSLTGPFPYANEFGYHFCIPGPDHDLDFERDHPARKKMTEEVEDKIGLVTLEALLAFAGPGIRLTDQAEGPPVRVIRSKDLGALGKMNPGEFQKIRTKEAIDESLRVKPGDLLLSATAFSGERSVSAIIAPEKTADMVPNQHVFLLRLKDPALGPALVEILGADWVTRQLTPGLHGRIELKELIACNIPKPDSSVVQAMMKLAETSTSLSRLVERFTKVRRTLLSKGNLTDQLKLLGELELQAEVFADTARSFDDFGRQVEQHYPLPLATAWRKMRITETPEKQWAAIFHAQETAVQFTACYLCADLRGKGGKLGALTQIFNKLERHGATLGEWTQLMQQAGTVSKDARGGIFPELTRLLAPTEDSEWWLALSKIRDLRNKNAHHKGPRTGLDYAEGCRLALKHLETIYKSLSFMSRYRLVEVVACHLDPLDGTRTARLRELAGDHPDIPITTRSVKTELGPGLYIEDGAKNLHLVSPWLIYAECEKCRVPRVFNPENVEGDKLNYKGLYCGNLLPRPKSDLIRLKKFMGLSE
ncbi:MAG: DUF4325 domain-containing protein [Acidobacteriota bacterium]|nr:DUF4325 domain-containing protein [Acidobacteriota bacterium]